MKESARAARSEIALKRQVTAVKEIAGEEQAAELKRLSGPARYPEVNALLQQELVADILEELDEASKSQSKVAEAAIALFDNRLGWSEGRQPYAPRETWADLGAAIYGEDDERVQELHREQGSGDDPPPDITDGFENAHDLSFLSDEQKYQLEQAGFDVRNIPDATDEELENVAHIGKATVKKIREATAQGE